MRRRNPWTLLRKRLEPLIEELHAAAPWRVEAPQTVESWLCGLSWEELWWCDEVVRWQLAQEPPQLCGMLISPTMAGEEEGEEEARKERVTRQLMHRMIYAADLSHRMRAAWRKEFQLTGDFPTDAKLVPLNPRYEVEELTTDQVSWAYPVWGRWSQVWK